MISFDKPNSTLLFKELIEMNYLVKGLSKFVLINLTLFSAFLLSGGHLFWFWEPFELAMVVSSVVIMLLFTEKKFDTPKNHHEWNVRQNALLGGCILGAASTFLMGSVYLLKSFDLDSETLGQLAASNLVGSYYALSLYYSFKTEIPKASPLAISKKTLKRAS